MRRLQVPAAEMLPQLPPRALLPGAQAQGIPQGPQVLRSSQHCPDAKASAGRPERGGRRVTHLRSQRQGWRPRRRLPSYHQRFGEKIAYMHGGVGDDP